MADPIIPADQLGEIRQRLADIDRRLRQLEAPTGTELNRVLQQVIEIVDNIDTIVSDSILRTSYDAATIDGKISTVQTSANNAQTAADNANANANGREPAFSILSPSKGGSGTSNAYNNVFTQGSWRAQWVLDSGVMGTSQSTRRVKQDFADPGITVAQLRQPQWTLFRYIEDVALNGDNATWRIGMVAEDLDDAGLGMFVTHDKDGLPYGIDYVTLSVAALHLAQQAWVAIDDLTKRIATIEGMVK